MQNLQARLTLHARAEQRVQRASSLADLALDEEHLPDL